MKLTTRIAYGFSLVIVTLAAVVGYCQYSLTATTKQILGPCASYANMAVAVGEVDSLAQKCRLAEIRLADAPDPDLAAEFARAVDALGERIGLMQALTDECREQQMGVHADEIASMVKSLAEDIDTQLAGWRWRDTKFKAVGEMPRVRKRWIAEAGPAESDAILRSMHRKLEAIVPAIESLRSQTLDVATSQYIDARTDATVRRAVTAVIAVIAVAATGILGLLTIRIVNRRMAQVARAAACGTLSALDETWHRIADRPAKTDANAEEPAVETHETGSAD